MKKEKGITLIALVITIIVMLILVAVTINMAVNEGLFLYAGKAAKDTESVKQEELELAEGSLEVGEKFYNSPQDFIDGIEATPKYSVKLLDANGVLTKNAIYTDTNNETVEIPKGFKVSSNSTENTKAGGLVIEDAIGNQFVWIPVNFNATGELDENGLYTDFLTVFKISGWNNNVRTTSLSTSFTEPYTSGYEKEVEEYYDMMKSVQEHKGFYIGRYEAGTDNARTSSSGVTNVVIKKGKYPYNYAKWGESTTNIGDAGAVALSKNMYTDSAKYGVVSTLCYGVQWDAMLDFIKDTNHNVSSSTKWGNYKDHQFSYTGRYSIDGSSWNNNNTTKPYNSSYLLQTGASEENKAKNIYDVAGNCCEWTMEACSASDRVFRSGVYGNSGGRGASLRSNVDPTYSYYYTSFRPALYIL